MVNFNLFTFLLAVTVVQGAPVSKRIAQVIVDSTAKWEKACLAAGGAQQCNPVSVTAFTTLLAAAGPCEQQDSADAMIDLAKTLNSDADMIKFAQIFAQQPRNTPTSQSVPYCGTAPKNAELNGLFQCQFAGADPTTFVGGLKVGDAGTIPFGLNAALNPAGSCKANPTGPIPDGTQLSDLTQDPGVSGSSGSSNSNNGSGAAAGSSSSSSSADNGAGSATTTAALTASSSSTGNSASGSSSSTSFTLQNGLDAQKLNAQFASLTETSSCQEGDTACINDGFAQCVGGAFVIATCGSGLTCAALPLVNKAGTSLTCTTAADAASRIAATGATGGLTGAGNGSANFAGDASSTTAATAPVVSPSSGGDFKTQNGQDAQKLNAQFAGLTADSGCQDGENACVNGAFAQCVGGTFITTQCNVGLQCFALPLVNSAGTSITCTTEADAQARIAASGASGGITG